MENLKEYLIKLGIYDSEKTERFKFFINILKEWNSFMNLTAIKDDEGIEIKHIIDSLTLFETDCISKDKKVLDVGSSPSSQALCSFSISALVNSCERRKVAADITSGGTMPVAMTVAMIS